MAPASIVVSLCVAGAMLLAAYASAAPRRNRAGTDRRTATMPEAQLTLFYLQVWTYSIALGVMGVLALDAVTGCSARAVDRSSAQSEREAERG